MAESFKFELVSPERLLMSADVESVRVPGDEGDFVVLSNHAPFMSTLRPGFVVIDGADGETSFFVKGGFADVGPTSLTVLAEFALDGNELKGDVLAAEREAAEAAVEAAESDAAKRHANECVSCLAEL